LTGVPTSAPTTVPRQGRGPAAEPLPAPPTAAPEPERVLATVPPRPRYVAVRTKFLLSVAGALAWVALSVWLSLPWVRELDEVTGPVAAVTIIAVVAYLPGGVVAFLAVSLVLDRQPPLRVSAPTQAVSIIIAARNEAAGIGTTLRYLAQQDYAGPLHVILADNGSTDGTARVARRAAKQLRVRLTVVRERRPGKSHALNSALARVRTGLVVTLDADTLPHRTALRHLVARLESSSEQVVSVAGSMLVRNSREGLWARMQEWDYFLGIASVKRMQGLYQGTLVAQGAFSLYRTDALRAVGGWPDAIGEDIVVTWKLLEGKGLVYFEPLAVAFTDVPVTLRHLAIQRARWARGMLEGLRTVPPWRQPSPMARALTGLDVLIPVLDVGYTFLWLPGLVLACFGHFWVVGPYTVFVLPITLVVNYLLYRFQRRQVFNRLGLRVRRNATGFVAYVLLYQAVMSPVAVYGYAQELLGTRRRWK
jgi:biofilm PGA synthesis N-glycosyltransferase PgaC